MGFETQSCGVAMGTRIAAQLWEYGKHVLARRVGNRGDTNITRVKAFGGRTFGVNYLVAVEHHVEIADQFALHDADVSAIYKMLRGNQNLVLAKQQFRLVTGEQDPVLGRDQKRPPRPVENRGI